MNTVDKIFVGFMYSIGAIMMLGVLFILVSGFIL